MFTRFRSGTNLKRDYSIASVLLVNTFSWLFIGQKILIEIADLFDKQLFLNLGFYASIIASALIGSTFSAKISKPRFFLIWLSFGIITSLFLGIPLTSQFAALAIAIIFGISVGLGIPSCLAYFAESVPVEKRGKVGGISLFITTFSVPLVTIAISPLDLVTSIIAFATWRGCCLLVLPFIPRKDYRLAVEKSPPSLGEVAKNKTFILYFVAWLMFSLVDCFEGLVLSSHIGGFRFLMNIIEPMIAGISALVAGVLSDWIGRKRVLIFGFVSLGVAYAIVGLSQIWITWVFYFVIDGVALGLLWVLFIIVIWGDLAKTGREKYYAIGNMPFFLTMITSSLLAPYVTLIPETSAFSLAAFFLFIAVIPLLYAPETLPQKKIQQRQLKIYTKEALRLKQKVEQK
jgi:MFS family permease